MTKDCRGSWNYTEKVNLENISCQTFIKHLTDSVFGEGENFGEDENFTFKWFMFS